VEQDSVNPQNIGQIMKGSINGTGGVRLFDLLLEHPQQLQIALDVGQRLLPHFMQIRDLDDPGAFLKIGDGCEEGCPRLEKGGRFAADGG
jgi:hypothetical protein